jgi:thiol-disulfide isomerase/thioredoxin
MKATRQLVSLCLVIGMTIGGNLPGFSQGPTVARAISYIPPSPSSNMPPPVVKNELKALNEGDKVPDIEFSLINYPTKNAKLSDFAGKLVILDFWATWCTTCLRNFPKMDSLQKKFNKNLQIILVNAKSTGDNFNKVDGFIRKWKSKYKDFQLPTAIMDSVAEKHFTHRLIPHYVWIGTDGNVMAITSSEQVSESNLTKFFQSGIAPSSKQREDNADPSHPIFLKSDVEVDDMTQYSFFSKGYKSGLPNGYRLRETNNGVRGIAITNTTILTMYKNVINCQMSNSRIDNKRIILEVKDSSRILFDKKYDRDEWNKDNLYSFELIVPVSENKSLYSYALNDLNRYSNYHGSLEKRITKCLVLKCTNSPAESYSKRVDKNGSGNNNQRHFKNVPVNFLVAFLNGLRNIITLPLIDGTNYTGKIDITLSPETENLNKLKAELKRYGYDLVEENRELEMLVIKDKQ